MGFDMENVLQAIRRREQGVFKQLFESYFKKMTLFAEYFLLDRGEAEDIYGIMLRHFRRYLI